MENNEYPSDYENEETDDDKSEEEKDTKEIIEPITKTDSREDVKPLKNKTFSYFEIREIENNNAVLMKKVLAHTCRQKQYKLANYEKPKVSNAEVNRRKKQRQIDHDNLVLLKKIQAIKPFGLSKTKS